MYNGSVRVPLTFQNNSLVVRGYIRTLVEAGCVRALKAVLGDKLKEVVDGPIGWKKVGEVWIGHHLSQYFQSPQYIPALREQRGGLCRSTLVEKDGLWELVEMTEPLDGLSDQEAEIEELKGIGRSRVLSFVAHYDIPQSPEDLGFFRLRFHTCHRGRTPRITGRW